MGKSINLPEQFSPEFEGLAEALASGTPSVSVRLNPRKASVCVAPGEPVAWWPGGRILDSRPAFTFDPAMHQGRYYVQDSSSMIHGHLVERLCKGRGPLAVLDACAAPGGKSIAALDAIPDGSLLLANEYVPARAEALRQNLSRWGVTGFLTSRGDTSRLRRLSGMFDIVIADVPCSGEGMFRKDAEAVRQWSPALVSECASLQRTIVENVWETLKPGGHLIYSTCTFNRSENQDNVRWMLQHFDCELLDPELPADWGIVMRDGCAHFLPGRVKGEGLTVALLRKGGSPSSAAVRRPGRERPRKDGGAADRQLTARAAGWLDDPGRFVVNACGDGVVRALPLSWAAEAAAICGALDMAGTPGLELGVVKGRDIVPSQELALSTALRRGAFPEVEVDYDTAVDYLQRQAVTLADDVPAGFVVLTYGGEPLGFVKNLGRRANNLYPQSWRILSTHRPEERPVVVR